MVDLMNIAQPFITTILELVVSLLAALAIGFVKNKTEKVKEEMNSELFNKYMDMIVTTTERVVGCVNQTFVNALKADGVFNGTLGKEAFDMALREVKLSLTQDCLEYIATITEDVDGYLRNYIEAEVAIQKNMQAV